MEQKNENDLIFRNSDSGPKYFFRGDYYEWGKLVLKPGDLFDEHYHVNVEETFFFLEGENVSVLSGDKTIPVKPGELLRFDAKEPHGIKNDGTCNAVIIFIKAPFEPDDKVMVDRVLL